jgi:hypothetical protein
VKWLVLLSEIINWYEFDMSTQSKIKTSTAIINHVEAKEQPLRGGYSPWACLHFAVINHRQITSGGKSPGFSKSLAIYATAETRASARVEVTAPHTTETRASARVQLSAQYTRRKSSRQQGH